MFKKFIENMKKEKKINENRNNEIYLNTNKLLEKTNNMINENKLKI